MDKVTMADIARMAGVTKSTVSRYFNGGYVKQETRERLQQVIGECHYQPNSFARLKARDSSVIGVVVPSLNSKITSRVITSIDRYLRGQGYETLIKNSDHDPELELRNIHRLMSLNVGGILLSSIAITDRHKKLLSESPIPSVVMAQDFEEGPCVVYDDYQAGLAVGRLAGASRPRRAAWLGVDEIDPAVGILRRKGVLDGLAAFGVTDVISLAGDYSYQSGAEMTRAALARGPVDALICATDRLAFGAYHVLAEQGLSIPGDVSVAGFGGYDESTLLSPQLTTLKFDSYALGYLSAETLLKLIREEPVPKKQVIGFQIIPGKSIRQPKDASE